MDNNLPNDPPNQNNNPPASPDGSQGGPPPFGSDFNPHVNPPDPNNPYQSQPPQNPVPNIVDPVQSWIAKHEHRDEHGRFVKSPQTTLNSQNSLNTPTSPNTSTPSSNPVPNGTGANSSFLPPLIEVNQNTNPSAKEDPPLFGFFITNPVTYLRKFLTKLLKNQAVTIKVPILTIILILTATGGFGLGFKSALYFAAAKIFPTNSPVLHRPFSDQGIIQKSSSGYFLKTKNNTLWELKSLSSNSLDTLTQSIGKQVIIKGNLTPEANTVEVKEIISSE